ncbi:Serine/threonine-protein phosphatase [Operophtera brumata]|uniref:Serine/threonine-protein phosphatase n=1 Tax=Operophtera brumata TaxID=104452 RepID=A0A0L7L4I5_OPEBR|nr:Serine/threonine-protein phosphatase [Operophtera brumata]
MNKDNRAMFKHYNDLCDVVSLMVYCPSERSYLLTKEANGEFWIPSNKSEKNCWSMTAQKLNLEVAGLDSLLNIQGIKNRLQWLNITELERQRAHCTLRSPEVAIFAEMAMGDHLKDVEAVNQIRMYREFVLMVYPALYMSPHVFAQFMLDLGWQNAQCLSLFRAADVTGRGGLSFLELLLWTAALEPATQHSGIPAEIRCRYIFRYFDKNRDQKLEYEEFKELVAATRAARQLPVDALSVARDVDVCLRELGIQPNSQLPLAEFLRGVGDLRLRGTSSLERDHLSGPSISTAKIPAAPVTPALAGSDAARIPGGVTSATRRSPSVAVRPDYSIAVNTVKLRRRARNEMLELGQFTGTVYLLDSMLFHCLGMLLPQRRATGNNAAAAAAGVMSKGAWSWAAPAEEAALGALILRLAEPVRVLCAAEPRLLRLPSPVIAPQRRATGNNAAAAAAGVMSKGAWSWAAPAEEAALGALILRLAEPVRVLCAAEPRLLRLPSPVIAVDRSLKRDLPPGDLHGNLPALLAIEEALWPSGTALSPSRILFLGDYVDRGAYGTELMAYLLAAKLQKPNAVFMVRGNHEVRDIQKMFTFYNECIGKFGETEGVKIWNAINHVFDALPLAAVVDDKVFCCHGGIPPPWVCPLITAIDKVPVPLMKPAEQSSIAWELMWNDPIKSNKMTASLALELSANEGYAVNTKRGTGHVFDQTAVDRFLLANQLSHIVRAHEVHQHGFKLR